MSTVTVEASKTYDVVIGRGFLDSVGAMARPVVGGVSAAVVTDDKVDALYGARLESSLAAAGYKTVKFVIPNGERSKSIENYIALLTFLAENRLTRSDVVFALGGGVVGDLAGFAAATYLRGVRLVQLPTTLLAAVDSSVGGKTAVDLAAGKNLVGAFYQPDMVICDCDTLSTLDEGVFRDGCAEVIKYGVICDEGLFDRLDTPVEEQLESVITTCVGIKRDIVCKDEKDTGLRQLLNLGHTVGHAVELKSRFGISHGSAVAIGMAIVSRACAKVGLCSDVCCEKIIALLEKYGLPTDTVFTADELYDIMLSDKKRDGDMINLVVPVEIGNTVVQPVGLDELREFIELGVRA